MTFDDLQWPFHFEISLTLALSANINSIVLNIYRPIRGPECKIEIFLKKDFQDFLFSDNEDYIPLNSVFKLPVVENLTELCVQLDCPGNYFNIFFLSGNEISISSVEWLTSKEKPELIISSSNCCSMNWIFKMILKHFE